MSGQRVYISVDMEGIAGVSRLQNADPCHATYPRGQELMTQEANAAICGAFEAGASHVVVADSHGPMDNILPERLDTRAHLLNGSPRACGMAHGLNEDFDAVFFVGYHAAANRPGVMSHTFSGAWTDFRLNGFTVSESDVNALYAALFGVPVKLLTGDDQICATGIAGAPGVRTVAVKKFVSYTAAEAPSPARVRDSIRDAAALALADPGHVVALPQRFEVEIDLKAPAVADLAAMIPTAERVAEHTVRVTCTSVAGVYGFATVANALATAHALG